MKYCLAILILFTSCHISYSETLFVKSDATPLTEQEHAIAYEIMIQTQFPTSLEYGQYAADEFAAMNEKLAQQLPHSGITAKFIPKTLYELFALKFIQDNCSYQNALDLRNEKTTEDTLRTATGDILQIDPYGSKKSGRCEIGRAYVPLKKALDQQKLLFELTTLAALKKFHHALNNTIHTLLVAHNLNPSSRDDALKTLNIFDFEKISISSGLRAYPIKNNIIKQALRIEYDAHHNKRFVLYRGTNTLDFEPYARKGVNLNRSISFGATLFAGALFDNNPGKKDPGACAYSYISSITKHAYALPINTQEYVNGDLKDMFIIPPMVTLLGIMSEGEDFHPRSKVVDTKKEIWGHFGNEKENITEMQMNSQHPPRVVYSRMLQYIKENHIPIKK